MAAKSASRPVTIVLLGEPVAFARSGHKGRQHFTPAKQRNTGAALRALASEQMIGRLPIDEPLRIDFLAEFPIPLKFSRADKHAAILGLLRPAKRPDIDNLYKLAADAMNSVVYRDDALIVEARLCKIYGLQPKIVVTVTPLGAA